MRINRAGIEKLKEEKGIKEDIKEDIKEEITEEIIKEIPEEIVEEITEENIVIPAEEIKEEIVEKIVEKSTENKKVKQSETNMFADQLRQITNAKVDELVNEIKTRALEDAQNYNEKSIFAFLDNQLNLVKNKVIKELENMGLSTSLDEVNLTIEIQW